MAKPTIVEMDIEVSNDGYMFGTINYDDDLITAGAKTQTMLEFKMKELLRDFHDLDKVEIKSTRR